MSFERRKVRTGRVIADKMDKTVVVAIERKRPHPLYNKAVRRRSRFNAHDEENEARIGDIVRIIESRPLSKTKRWRMTGIVSRDETVETHMEELDLQAADAMAEPVAAGAAALDAAGPEQPEPGPVADNEDASETVAETETAADDFDDQSPATAEDSEEDRSTDGETGDVRER